ncbi:MAG: hypothetical protein K6T65_01915 [Peptococcaceae bacterium]|nr:hypothetical protein [Peptococcaceae bacterium]
MRDRDCSGCLVKDLQKLHLLMEKRMAGKLPEEVRKPLLEAKKQMRLALRGFIGHLLEEDPACNKKKPGASRPIKLD